MNKKPKIYGSIIAIVLTLFILSTALESSTINDLFWLSAVLGGIGIAAKIVQNKKLSQHLNQLNQRQQTGINFGIDDCRDIAKEWAKNNYSGELKKAKGMSFDWTQASSDIAPVYDFSKEEWIHARYFYTQYGPKNKGTLIFIDATNGEVMSPKPVKKHKLKDEPFEHLEMYRMTRKMAGRIGMSNGEQNHRNPGYVPVSGIPVNQDMMPQEHDTGENN